MKFTEDGNLTIEDGDNVISLEGITKLEKVFINMVRLFKGEEWLQGVIEELFTETIDSLVKKSVEDRAMRFLTHEIRTRETEDDEAYDRFMQICSCIDTDEEFIEDMIHMWRESVENSILGELRSIEQDS